MNHKPIEIILPKLAGVKQTKSNEWMAICSGPGHKDNKQSLHITEKNDGTVLLKCHAGCRNQDIMDALGLQMRALFPPKQSQPSGAHYYEYRNETGKLIYRTVRRYPKGFYQQRSDGQGGWISNLNEITALPYRLPELIIGIAEDRTVLIVEGEKDADNLTRQGFVATTNHGGAGKWAEHHSKYFPSGTQVVILPDNDLPGMRHAESVAKQLTLKGCKVKIVALPDLPEKGDISDWLAKGGTKEQLEQIIADTLECSINPKTLSNVKVTPLSEVETVKTFWIWLQGRLALNHVTLLAGDPGQGKSYFGINLAAAISQGKGLPVIENERLLFRSGDINGSQKVLILAYEDDSATIKERAIQAGAYLDNILILEGTKDHKGDCQPITAESIHVLRETIETLKPALVIVDPIQAYTGSRTDIHRANEVQSVMAGLTSIARDYECAVLVIAHMNKSSAQGNALYRVIGSIAFVGAVRTAILMARDHKDKDIRHLVWIKSNLAKEPEALKATIDHSNGGWRWIGPSNADATELLAPPIPNRNERNQTTYAENFLLEILADGPLSTNEILKTAEKSGLSQRTIERAKSKLGIKSFRENTSWKWILNSPTAQDRQVCQIQKVGGVSNIGGLDWSDLLAKENEDNVKTN